jgi:uncharacterized protein (DUF1015 family)
MANHPEPDTPFLMRPFPALRPTAQSAEAVAAPPYDVLSSAEARRLAADRPWSFLHVSKAEIDLPEDIDVHAPEVYAKAAENLQAMLRAGVLIREAAPCYYIYRVSMGEHVQTGVVGGGSVTAYDQNRIRRHEFTRPDKEDDRVRQIDAVNAQTGPVFLVHRPSAGVGAVIAHHTARPPELDVLWDKGGDNDVRHQLWVVDQPDDIAALSAAFDAMDALYIADGHHRSAAASRVAAARRAAHPEAGPEAPWNAFLVVSFPENEVRILDYNRVVRDLAGRDEKAFLAEVGRAFDISPCDGPAKPDQAHRFGMYLGGQWYRLTPREALPPTSDPVARLDISLLADRLLEPVLGITNPRTDTRIDFIGGIRGMAELERRVDSGEMAVAFALFPTRMADLLAVADAGKVMPPKSTWFEPKLADGMASLPLD